MSSWPRNEGDREYYLKYKLGHTHISRNERYELLDKIERGQMMFLKIVMPIELYYRFHAVIRAAKVNVTSAILEGVQMWMRRKSAELGLDRLIDDGKQGKRENEKFDLARARIYKNNQPAK